MNEDTAGGAPHDPLLGWAGLDTAGRIVSLGGRADRLHEGVRVGLRLADALREPAELDRFIAEAGTSGSIDPGRQLRCRLHWAVPEGGMARPVDDVPAVELLLRRAYPPSGPVRIAAEFHRELSRDRLAARPASTLLAPLPIATASVEAADLWRLGSALYAATVAPSAMRPAGLIRFALHPVPLPRIVAVADVDPWLGVALARLAASAAQLGVEAVAARTGTRELTVWVRDGTGCETLCEHWLTAMTASPLVGSRCRLVVGPAAGWCVMPADGTVLGHLLDALDAVYDPADPRPRRPPIPVSSVARERDIDERRDALTGTLVELVASGRARLVGEPIVDAPTGVVAGLHLRAEFRSLFAVAELLDYLPDIVDDDVAADALNIWLAAAIRNAGLPARQDVPQMLQLRIAPAQLRRLDSLAGVVAALCEAGGGVPCLLLPEAAVHRDAYLVIDAATEVAALGAVVGIDDYRGLLPVQPLAQAGIGGLRLHRSLVRELGERSFAGDRLADLLARARASGLSVLVPGLADRTMVSAAMAAGALHLSGPVFGRPRRLLAASPSLLIASPTAQSHPPAQESPDGQGPVRTDRRPGAR
ncbi:MAG: EAL domain-containing protein [Rhodocyclaceae bacterium]|nr:EAL domain-containing protein [Rhodocyclaceae bacterium]MCA3076031.1 EAL domain-containing protein [Rhodocyclaceae bacterium]MCA3092166.1 EAL domain-containing protein [Rhodocyclaceae bacterium]MCA3095386.1 EAL domain-containing protein [Rhodocyclaceae bacterium]MCA3096574.1 EAL domain-containing protein [Rhodocyclaceae bacterium]